MKILKLIIALLTLFLTSCNLESKIEHLIESSTEQNQIVVQSFSVPTIETTGEQQPINFDLDTSLIKERIDNFNSRTGEYDLAFINELKLSTPEGNFDFLESASIEVTTEGDFEGLILGNIENVPESSTELSLKLSSEDVNLIELIEDENFEVNVNFSSKETSTAPIEIELQSDFIINTDFKI